MAAGQSGATVQEEMEGKETQIGFRWTIRSHRLNLKHPINLPSLELLKYQQFHSAHVPCLLEESDGTVVSGQAQGALGRGSTVTSD